MWPSNKDQDNAEDNGRVGSRNMRATLTDALGLLQDDDDGHIRQRVATGLPNAGYLPHHQFQNNFGGGFTGGAVAQQGNVYNGTGGASTFQTAASFQQGMTSSAYGNASRYEEEEVARAHAAQQRQQHQWKQQQQWKKPNNRPKRPLSAYNIFFQHERQRLRDNQDAENEPGPGFAGLARHVAAKWKALDGESRKIYEEKAMLEKQKYMTAMNEWKKEEKIRKKEAAKRARRRERAELAQETKQESKTTESVAQMPLRSALLSQMIPSAATVMARANINRPPVAPVSGVMSTSQAALMLNRAMAAEQALANDPYEPLSILPPTFQHRSMSLPTAVSSAAPVAAPVSASRRASAPVEGLEDEYFFDIMNTFRSDEE